MTSLLVCYCLIHPPLIYISSFFNAVHMQAQDGLIIELWRITRLWITLKYVKVLHKWRFQTQLHHGNNKEGISLSCMSFFCKENVCLPCFHHAKWHRIHILMVIRIFQVEKYLHEEYSIIKTEFLFEVKWKFSN